MVIAHNFVGIKWNNINFNSLHTYLYKSMNVKSTKKKIHAKAVKMKRRN